MTSSLWLGTYTGDSGGHGRGIARIALADDGAITAVRTAASVDSPSFVATHPTLPVVYAVQEFARRIQAFRVIDGGNLVPLGDPHPAGEAVCHVAVAPHGRYAVATCWGDGRVFAYELDEAGAIVGRTQAQASVDPYREIAEEPRPSRAHSSLFLPDGRVLTTDLGHDTVRVWRAEGAELVPVAETVLPFGSGPRHMALHPSGHVYVVTEYSIEVAILEPETLSVTSVVPALAAGAHDGDAGAHISFDGDSRVHTTVRGANAVGVLEVTDAGAGLAPLADVDCGGNWPRHHLQLGDRLYVANQLSEDIAVFRIVDGLPVLEATVPTGSPTCLVPVAG
ncbi:beta-propeller fold lactonase family protein [Humibacter sp. RRB41]|uniref:lactonase family protein n=1 Tax=Humibacter sp. RRB41 TaxID=2919946 RepID=UPI001FAB0551|nr:beta-propeller fold lactonase family protein [Humibacter sp. RRB41]